jgi:predicted lipase
MLQAARPSLGAAFALLLIMCMAACAWMRHHYPQSQSSISTSLKVPLRLSRYAAGGHSLGGAFALLMVCMARVRMDFDPTAIRCYAFGAPPVLSLSEKTAAQNVMSVST